MDMVANVADASPMAKVRAMRAHVSRLGGLIALALTALAHAQSPPPIALVGGAVIDGTGAARVENTTVLIEGDRITAVGRDLAIPAGAKVVDVSGKTLVPGLFDMHGHYYGNVGGKIVDLFEPYARLYLAGGVTTTFSPGDFNPAGMVAFAARVRRGENAGPRILTAGPYIDLAPSAIGWIEGVKDADAAVAKLAEWRNRIDGVKVYTSITEAQLAAVIDAAHTAKLRVTGHLRSVTAARAIALGIDRLEHGIFAMSEFAEGGSDPYDLDYYQKLAALDLDAPNVRKLIDAIAGKRVVLDPTIVILQTGLAPFEPVTQDFDKYIAPAVLARYQRVEQMTARMTKRHGDASNKAIEGAIGKAKEFAVCVHRGGGVVVAGTDPVDVRVLPGWGLHRELRNFVEGGMRPLEALRCASYNAAHALGLADRLGTLEPGKHADIVVVDGDPSVDITALAQTTAVYRDGVAYDPRELRKGAEGAIQ
jgi:imidazolonepropionase-like amidohydrolase